MNGRVPRRLGRVDGERSASRRGPPRSSSQLEWQMLQRVVQVRTLPARRPGELDHRESVEELDEEDAPLEPGEVDTETEMLSDPKRQLRIRVASNIELVRVSEDLLVAVRRRVDHRDLVT